MCVHACIWEVVNDVQSGKAHVFAIYEYLWKWWWFFFLWFNGIQTLQQYMPREYPGFVLSSHITRMLQLFDWNRITVSLFPHCRSLTSLEVIHFNSVVVDVGPNLCMNVVRTDENMMILALVTTSVWTRKPIGCDGIKKRFRFSCVQFYIRNLNYRICYATKEFSEPEPTKDIICSNPLN